MDEIVDFVVGNFAVSGDLDQALLLAVHCVQRGQHLKDDGRQLAPCDKRYVPLADRALLRAVAVAQRRALVLFGHRQHLVGAGHGAFVLNFFNALGGYRFQQLTGFFAGQAQLLAGKLVAVFIFFGGCTSHVRPRFLIIDKSVAHFPVCRKGFDRELLHFARRIAIIYSVNLYATEGFSHELDR